MQKFWFVLSLLFSPCAVTRAASFDCAKAATPREKAVCTSPELSRADDEMAAAYRAVLAAAPVEMIGEIRDGQRAWLRGLTGCDPDADAALWACLSAAYASRINDLRHMILRDEGITFVWRSVELTAPAPPPRSGVSIGSGLPAHGYLHATWPQVNSTMPEWQAWNKAVKEATVRVASLQTPPAADLRKVVSPDMDIDVATSVELVGPRLVTATIDNQWYGHGAAHPNENSIQFNWLLKERREVRPEDVFQADSAWAKMLQDQCDRYLHETLDPGFGQSYENFYAPGMMPKILHGIVVDPENWQLDVRGLTIIFQTYAIACRVCTPPPFTIPWAELKELINPDFRVPPDGTIAAEPSTSWRLNPR